MITYGEIPIKSVQEVQQSSHQIYREIALTCTTLADMEYGLTNDLVEVVIYDYLKENDIPNPFTGGVPGCDWWQRFLKHWPRLSERKPQHLSKKRAQAGNGDIINAWFDKLDEVFSSAGLNPYNPSVASRLWNCDETAFCTSPAAIKLLAQRGSRTVHEIGGGLWTSIHHSTLWGLCIRKEASSFYPVQKEEYVEKVDRGWSCRNFVWGNSFRVDGCSQLPFLVYKAVSYSSSSPY